MIVTAKLFHRWATTAAAAAALVVLAAAAAAAIFPVGVVAYEEDTHYMITFIVLRAVGFRHDDALTVAAMDQGLDDSFDTDATKKTQAGTPIGPNPKSQFIWHALDPIQGDELSPNTFRDHINYWWRDYTKNKRLGVSGLLQRKEFLAQQAQKPDSNKHNKLQRMGIFFHYQQDTWAHRHHDQEGHLTYQNWKDYETPEGHAPDGNQPDRVPYDPKCAVMAAEDTARYALRFLQNGGLNQTANSFFDNFQPRNNTHDIMIHVNYDGVSSITSKNDVVNGTPAQFFDGLIQKQISLYTQDWLGYWNKCADDQNYNRVLQGLQDYLDLWSDRLGNTQNFTIPSRKEKENEGFLNLQNADLVQRLYKDGWNGKGTGNKDADGHSVRRLLGRGIIDEDEAPDSWT